jgi:hypothetical protein
MADEQVRTPSRRNRLSVFLKTNFSFIKQPAHGIP